MMLAERQSFSFIVKIWLEETAVEAGSTTWRGSIISVQEDDRQLIDNLEDIIEFIQPYLLRLGTQDDS